VRGTPRSDTTLSPVAAQVISEITGDGPTDDDW